MCEDIQLYHGKIGRLPPRKPCIECPLRKDSKPGALGGYSPTMYAKALHGPADLACHLSSGFKDGEIERQKSCAGVAAYRASMGILTAHPLSHVREAIKFIGNDPEQIAVGMCFTSMDDFIQHHFVQEGLDADWWVLPNGRSPDKPCGT